MSELITWRDVPGWFDFMDLYDEVAMTTPTGSTIVEVGVCFGKSLLYLAQKIKETGKDIQIVAVDRWLPYPDHKFIYEGTGALDGTNLSEGEHQAYLYAKKHGGTYAAFTYNLAHSGLADSVNVIRADSESASRMFTDKPPYFVFIDADHDYGPVKLDIDSWWATGPDWMAGHDYNRGSEENFPGVWQAVHEKWGQENVGWRNHTCWVVRRSHLERPVKPIPGTGLQMQETMTARPYAERP